MKHETSAECLPSTPCKPDEAPLLLCLFLSLEVPTEAATLVFHHTELSRQKI